MGKDATERTDGGESRRGDPVDRRQAGNGEGEPAGCDDRICEAPMLKDAIGDVAIDVGGKTTSEREQPCAEDQEWVGRGEDSAERPLRLPHV